MKLIRLALLGCILLSIFAASGIVFTKVSKEPKKSEEDYFRLFKNTYQLIKEMYVDQVDTKTLIYGAIQGMVASLKDPHTSLFVGEVREQFLNKIKGHFTGIGVYIAPHEKGILIVGSVKGGPAWEIGIQANDVIVKAGGVDLAGKSLEDSKGIILGKPGSKIPLEVLRGKKIRKMVVERRQVKVHTVSHRIISGSGVKLGYIKVDQFSDQTDQEFNESIEFVKSELIKGGRIDEQGSPIRRGIVIDLRNNPGGLLNIVADMVNRFLSKGVIVTTKDRYKEVDKFEATREVTPAVGFFPLIVLINQHSASASEIMSGALKDHGRALVIGKNSFGKFSVQRIFDIDPGYSSLKLTIARYYLPSGKSFPGKGVSPHITLTNEPNQNLLRDYYLSETYWSTEDALVKDDPALSKAVDVLREEKIKQLLK